MADMRQDQIAGVSGDNLGEQLGMGAVGEMAGRPEDGLLKLLKVKFDI